MNTRPDARVASVEGERTGARILRLLAALILVNGLLLCPSWVLAGRLAPPWVALEAGLIVAVFALLRDNRWTRYAAVATAGLITLLTVVGFADTAIRLSLGRPVNLYVDIWLLSSVRDLLVGTLGWVLSLVVVAAVLGALVLATLLLAYLLAPAHARPAPLSRRLGALGLAALVSMGLTAERMPALARYVAVPGVQLAVDQARAFVEMTKERERFAEALERSPDTYEAVPGLFSRLHGRDVVFAFIESYGVTALYDPRYAPVVGPRLDDLEARMQAAGLHVVSGRLVAPTQGGESWYSHGSLMSGLWLDNQLRYDMMLAAGRKTLIDDFRAAGYRTVALMPAITLPWPEGRRLGYDRIFARKDIDYAGPPLNWVTMPDQFSWSFLQSTIREGGDRPLFAEVALISSHAPWTPILPVLDDWDTIGDGLVFEPWANAGERPEKLWLDTDRVREHYAMSIEYALHAATAYAERFVDDRILLVILGDHQPAPLVTGDGAVWEVPVHVISGDARLLEPFLDWGFVEGAWPDTKQAAVGMDYFRDWFVRAYSGS